MPKKILVIDDEKDMRIYLGTLFRTAGYEVLEAANGEEGRLLAKECAPDLITLDVLMPKRSGIKAFRDLRAEPGTAAIPVVIVSGLTRREELFDEDLADIRRPEAIFEKPIERESFLSRIGELIGA